MVDLEAIGTVGHDPYAVVFEFCETIAQPVDRVFQDRSQFQRFSEQLVVVDIGRFKKR